MGVLWTHEMYVAKVEELVGSKYIVLGKYEKNNINVTMKHVECGKVFDMRPNCFKRGRRCPHCFGTKKKTSEQFRDEIYSLVKNEYLPIEEYAGTDKHLLMRHEKCGHEWMITPYKFLSGRRCPRCAGTEKKTTIVFKKEVLDLVGMEYTILTEYKGAHTKVLFRHNVEKCSSSEFLMRPTDFLSGKRCPNCHHIQNRGESHPRYDNTLTNEDRSRRDSMRGFIKVWRNRVFKRDRYMCRKCMAVGGNINAHHINSWDIHKEERFDVKNGATLCGKCHSTFHKTYGYGNNTEEEFLLYISSN